MRFLVNWHTQSAGDRDSVAYPAGDYPWVVGQRLPVWLSARPGRGALGRHIGDGRNLWSPKFWADRVSEMWWEVPARRRAGWKSRYFLDWGGVWDSTSERLTAFQPFHKHHCAPWAQALISSFVAFPYHRDGTLPVSESCGDSWHSAFCTHRSM